MIMQYKRIAAYLILGSAVAFSSAAQSISSVISEVQKELAPDKRQVVYELTVAAPTEEGGDSIICGKLSEESIHQALIASLEASGLSAADSIQVLPVDLWGQVRISVACFRTAPSHGAEMATQGIMGMPVRLLEYDDGWWRAQTPDGYIAYVTDGSVTEKSAEQMLAWRTQTPRVIVTALWQTHVFSSADPKGVRDIVSDVVNGNILEGEYDAAAEYIKVALPDGRQGYIKSSDVSDLKQWASQGFDPEKIMETAYSMMGTPYLWGGTSPKTLDCSGFSKVSYFSNAIILMRDASQQATTGTRIEAEDWRTCQTGDLLFFGNAKTRRVTHVAIYDHDGHYIHSSGRVKTNSVDPESEDYLTTPFLHAVRIDGNQGTRGITRVEEHPWYF